MEHLRSEEASILEFIAAKTADGDTRAATLAAGSLLAVRSLWEKLHPPEPAVSEPEEPFVDPATIREPQR